LLGIHRPAQPLDLREADEFRMAVPPHPPPVLDDDALDLGEQRLHLEKLVGLFLIFTEHRAGVGEVDELSELGG
jgi:hypothetical protein